MSRRRDTARGKKPNWSLHSLTFHPHYLFCPFIAALHLLTLSSCPATSFYGIDLLLRPTNGNLYLVLFTLTQISQSHNPCQKRDNPPAKRLQDLRFPTPRNLRFVTRRKRSKHWKDFEKLSLWGKCILSELGLPAHCSRKLSTPFPGTFRGRQTTPSALRFFSPEGFQPDFSFYKQMSRSTSGFPERRAEEPLSFLLFFPSHTT